MFWHMFLSIGILLSRLQEKKEWTKQFLFWCLSGCTFDLSMHKAIINHVNDKLSLHRPHFDIFQTLIFRITRQFYHMQLQLIWNLASVTNFRLGPSKLQEGTFVIAYLFTTWFQFFPLFREIISEFLENITALSSRLQSELKAYGHVIGIINKQRGQYTSLL